MFTYNVNFGTFNTTTIVYYDDNFNLRKIEESYLSKADAFKAIENHKHSYLFNHYTKFVECIQSSKGFNYYYDNQKKRLARKELFLIKSLFQIRKLPDIIKEIVDKKEFLKATFPSNQNNYYRVAEKRYKEIISFCTTEYESLKPSKNGNRIQFHNS